MGLGLMPTLAGKLWQAHLPFVGVPCWPVEGERLRGTVGQHTKVGKRGKHCPNRLGIRLAEALGRLQTTIPHHAAPAWGYPEHGLPQ